MKLLWVFAIIGIIFGIGTGISLGRYICATIIKRRNTTSEEKEVPFQYSTRGIEIMNRSSADLDLGPLNFGKKKVSTNEREYNEALDYFKRNKI